MYSISEASRLLGVSIPTLQRWDKKKQLIPLRTMGNRRRYTLKQIQDVYGVYTTEPNHEEDSSPDRTPYLYARVSALHQQLAGNLDRQIEHLVFACHAKYGQRTPYHLIKEYGSGLNPNRKGLLRLLTAIRLNKVSTLFITFWDRISRFGWNFIEMLCQDHHTTIIVTDQSPTITSEEEFIQDFMALLAIFSGKLYKRRALQANDVLRQKKHLIHKTLSYRDSEDLWVEYELSQAIIRGENIVIRQELRSIRSHPKKSFKRNKINN